MTGKTASAGIGVPVMDAEGWVVHQGFWVHPILNVVNLNTFI